MSQRQVRVGSETVTEGEVSRNAGACTIISKNVTPVDSPTPPRTVNLQFQMNAGRAIIEPVNGSDGSGKWPFRRIASVRSRPQTK